MRWVKRIFWVLLLTSPITLFLVWLCHHSGEIAKGARDIVIWEAATVLSGASGRFIEGYVGEGNDSWMEYHFKLEVITAEPLTVTTDGGVLALEGGKNYTLGGIATFSGSFFATNWSMDSFSLKVLKPPGLDKQ